MQAMAFVDNPSRETLLRESTEIAIRDQTVVPLHCQVNVWAACKCYVYTPHADERTCAH